MKSIRLATAALCLVLAACSPRATPSPTALTPSESATSSGATDAPSTSAPTDDLGIAGLFDVGGFSLWLECAGSGSPTVLFEAGLGSGQEAWSAVAPRVARSARACTYDRAGIGQSESRPETTTTAGAMADELARLLVAAGIDGPIVLVGHSNGGMVVQLAADRIPAVAGVVLVDSSSGPQFAERFSVTNHVWDDSGTVIDQEGTVTELAAVELGEVPLVVLTQAGLEGDLGAAWARYQVGLATLSPNSLHLTATGAGHGIQMEAPNLVVAAVAAVVDAATGAAPLPACTEFQAVGGDCFAE